MERQAQRREAEAFERRMDQVLESAKRHPSYTEYTDPAWLTVLTDGDKLRSQGEYEMAAEAPLFGATPRKPRPAVRAS